IVPEPLVIEMLTVLGKTNNAYCVTGTSRTTVQSTYSEVILDTAFRELFSHGGPLKPANRTPASDAAVNVIDEPLGNGWLHVPCEQASPDGVDLIVPVP